MAWLHVLLGSTSISRERDEPDNIYRYAEDYYADAQDETSYNCADYDNTINDWITPDLKKKTGSIIMHAHL